MKGVGHGRSHAAVLGDELIERGNGNGVAKDNGNLPTLVTQGGLPLRAGLGLGCHDLPLGLSRAPLLHVRNAALGDFNAGPAVLTNPVHEDVESAVAGGFDFELRAGGQVLHFVSPCGPIPPMDESLHVTSDTSTPCANNFLNGATA